MRVTDHPRRSKERADAAFRRHRSLITAVIALALLFAGVLWVTARVTEASSLAQLLGRGDHDLRLYIANIRRELDRYEYLPKLLADDHQIKGLLDHSWDFKRRKTVNHYLKFVAKTSGASDIYLMDRNGLTLAASNWDKADSFIGDNYSFRPYFQEAVKGRLGHYYALGLSSGQRGYYFAYPVKNDQGSIKGVIAVKVSLASLEKERGGAHYEFVVTDPHGVIFLSTRPQWRYHTFKPLPPDLRKQIQASRRYLEYPLKPLPDSRTRPFNEKASLLSVRENGATVTYLQRGVRMPSAGWEVHILLNISPIGTDVNNALILAAFIMGAVVLIGLILFQRRARLDERVRFEHAAMESAEANEARVRAIIDNTRAGLVTLGANGLIESFNPTAESLFRRPAATVYGIPLTELLAPESRTRFQQLMAQAGNRTPEQPLLELTGHLQDGTPFPLEASVNGLVSTDGVHYIVTLHDISERKEHEAALQEAYDQLELRVAERTSDLLDSNRRLTREIGEHRRTERELSRARDELIQAAKLAAIGQLSAGINHELNQPLTAIRFYAGNARAFLDKARVDEVRENLLNIDGLTERMARIINQLKLFARKSSGKPVVVSLTAVIEGALTLLAPRLQREHVAVIRHLPDDEVYCLGDMVRLEQVLVNLISNALQAMEDLAEPRLDISVTLAEGRVMASVRDRGPGIPPAQLPQIFDPFFTTKEVGEGLGLGLSISMRIVEELGGTLHAENHSDGGAVFTIILTPAPVQEKERA